MPKRTGEVYTWKNGKKVIFECEEPKRLSKYGEWRRANPNGIGVVLDWKAVMK